MSGSPDTPDLVRRKRQSGLTDTNDPRTPFQRDRDRILYSENFRRLAGVTQVASAGDGGVFHNRLTHSIKVAQVGKRLAERLLRDNSASAEMLDPDVVEAACLAHDLGHPPFGHVAEHALDELAQDFGLEDGFEGNAQTFRILTRLALHAGRKHGLDLTKAVLEATLKYPWLRAPDRSTKPGRKFSSYISDKEAFDFARGARSDTIASLEAQVMDEADSITYSVHDLEDFRRAGLIPLEKIVRNPEYQRAFMRRWAEESPEDPAQLHFRKKENYAQIADLLDLCISDTTDPGSQEDSEVLDRFRSAAITRFLGDIHVKDSAHGPVLDIPQIQKFERDFLHRLVKRYVILSPRLATQQQGQVRIIKKLAKFFNSALKRKQYDWLPARFAQKAESLSSDGGDQEALGARLAIDIVASLSESEAIHIYRRIMGQHVGSILDPIY